MRIALGPGFAQPYTNLGNALRAQDKWAEALEAYQLALQLSPDFPEGCRPNLPAALHDEGKIHEAIALYRRALDSPGPSPGIYDNFLATLHYSSQTTLQDLRVAHEDYDRRYAQPFRTSWQPHPHVRDPRRPLRLGFISPNFRTHPVGHFSIPLFENLDRREFEPICYYDSTKADGMTSRLHARVAEWNDVWNISDEQLADRIRADHIDILFDLAGHTPGNRLLVFARKPAPVQITWLDYVGTTGLSAIDYILADARQIPPEAEPYYCEKVLRMPDDYICFDPPPAAPEVGPLPAMANGFVTFGSFNILPAKPDAAQIVGVWGRILREIPDARLVLKNRRFATSATIARFRQQFAEQSIDPSRIIFQGRSPYPELLASYSEVDIALDTFPYNGGLTTCEALWMGVPVVTCAGETFASRHGLAHLTAAGVPESVAGNFDEYVRIAVALAADHSKLAALRRGLRARVAGSALCDGPRFAANLGRILRDVWQRWCEASG